jgi:MoaA/NifB/PqqE/SkfB family radical SAM enzyme
MKFAGRVLIFPVLHCNQSCTYCTNEYGTHSNTLPVKGYSIAAVEKWVEFVSKLETSAVEFLGGEPALYPDFDKIVNALSPHIPATVGSNCSDRSLKTLLKIEPRGNVQIQASYHQGQTSIEKFARNVRSLLSANLRVGVHTMPHWKADEFEYLRATTGIEGTSHGLISDHSGWVAFEHTCLKPRSEPKTVACPVAAWRCIAPDGTVYTCHALMYAKSSSGVLGNVFDKYLNDVDETTCAFYGWCNPCDIGRFTHAENTLRHERLRAAHG